MNVQFLTPDRFIASLRNSHPDMEVIFRNGSCFEFFNIMRNIWPHSKAWHHIEESHVYVELDNRFYDIRGRAYPNLTKLTKLTDVTSGRKAHRWSQKHPLRVHNESLPFMGYLLFVILPVSLVIWAWILISLFS